MPKIVENALLIYTDGSLYPKGRKGGYGIVFIHVNTIGEEVVLSEHSPPGVKGTTGNRMELQACIEALKMAPDASCFNGVGRVVVRTDSRYVANNYLNALGHWPTHGWKNPQGRPLDNADLWKEFKRVQARIRKRFEIHWVKGHGKGSKKDPYNARADKLAKESANNPLSRNVFRSSVRRKISSNYTKRGSVTIRGQTMVIYVVEVQWMSVQKIWKYRYEVASPDNPDHLNVDLIYSDKQMRDGHYYEVQVNEDMAFPKILEVLQEKDPLTFQRLLLNGNKRDRPL